MLAAVALLAPDATAGCGGEEWRVVGVVEDSSGNALPGARVYVLMDKISEKEFRKQGLRASTVTSDSAGRFAARVICGQRPDPCSGKKPKNLTVAAEARGYAARLKVYRLGSLEIVESPYGCTLRVPELVLSRSY